MAKTVKEHTDQTDALIQQLKSGDELLKKAQSELYKARNELNTLRKFTHPEFKVDGGARNNSGHPIVITMDAFLLRRINAISALLGDRAEQSA